jgi:hypothetical protein
MAFGSDGNLYVSGNLSDNVVRFDGTTGAFLGEFATGIVGANGIAFGPDGNLYVAAEFGDAIVRVNGTNGTFIDNFAIVTGPIGILFDVTAPPTNRPPVAGTPFIKVIGDEVSEIPARRFVIWCSDPDNDPLNLTAVTSPSAMGALVTLETNRVSYEPPVGFMGADTFGYTISDGMAALPRGPLCSSLNPECWPRPQCFRRLRRQARCRSTSPDSLTWVTRSSGQSRSTVRGRQSATCSPMITGRQASPIGIRRPAALSIAPSIIEGSKTSLTWGMPFWLSLNCHKPFLLACSASRNKRRIFANNCGERRSEGRYLN